METINFVLGVLVTYFALFLGMILARLTKEELKPGEKYFQFFKMIVLIVILIVILYITIINRNLLTFGIIFAISLYLIFSKGDEIYVYALLGFIIYYSSQFFNLFLLQSVLIFALTYLI